MSDNRPDSIEQCIVDITECPICHDVFLDNRCLPCLHTFCLKCLESYRQKNGKGKPLPCPVCRREFSIPKGVADLSRNFFIDKLIDAHKIKKPKVLSKNCEICSEDTKVVPATRFCCDCRQNLCLPCEKQHKRIAATTMHKVIDGTNATNPQELTPRPTYCIAHKTKEAEVYCQDCKKVICWECKSESHNSHTSIKISSAAKDLAAKLEGHIEQISEHLRIKRDDIQNVAEREKVYTDEIEVESANICRELSKLYRNITDNGDKLKKALAASTTVHLGTFRLLRNKLDSDVNELKKHKVYIEQMIHLGNVSDLCEYTEKLISETTRMTSENACKVIVPPVAHLSDLELQDLLTGRRTDIDHQYKSNNYKEQMQDDLHPEYSKEEKRPKERSCETSSAKFKHSETFKGTEKKQTKPGSSKDKGALKSMSLPRSHSRDKDSKAQPDGASYANKAAKDRSEDEPEKESSFSDDTGTLTQVVVANDKRDNVLLNQYNLPESTEATAVKTLPTNPGEPLTKYSNRSLLGTLSFEVGEAVCGVTILNAKIYTVFQNRDNVQVYDSAVFAFLNSFKVDGLVNPNDIASCNFNNCLYICDWGKPHIFRLKIGEEMEQMNWSTDADLGGLSVTAEHNVLLAGYISNKLKEYTSKGKLIRSVSLEDDFKPWHAIRLASSDFVICQGDNTSEFHRVCLIDAIGKLKMSFGGIKGSDEKLLCGPYHVTVDESGCILVNDCNNRRILLLGQDLKFIKEVIPSSANVLRRARRMCLDEVAGRLYVADNVSTGSETKDGRILVFSIS